MNVIKMHSQLYRAREASQADSYHRWLNSLSPRHRRLHERLLPGVLRMSGTPTREDVDELLAEVYIDEGIETPIYDRLANEWYGPSTPMMPRWNWDGGGVLFRCLRCGYETTVPVSTRSAAARCPACTR